MNNLQRYNNFQVDNGQIQTKTMEMFVKELVGDNMFKKLGPKIDQIVNKCKDAGNDTADM